ncbi:hypothetical protein HanRHA438_Chr04g0184061 [Helianthus annuus]|nr:hypothetical protein HanRHA438_Chr04g0184061 [Helianthus annuus]
MSLSSTMSLAIKGLSSMVDDDVVESKYENHPYWSLVDANGPHDIDPTSRLVNFCSGSGSGSVLGSSSVSV